MSDRLLLRSATRAFGAHAGVFELSMSIAPGEVHALVGLNGAGKPTMMRTALGMLHLTHGDVYIDGVSLARLPANAWRRVGHFVEHPFAYPELTTRANLELAARLHGVASARVADVVDTTLTELNLERYANVAARRLSQGNRQRLGLAAALQHHPTLIVLDEPTNALDPAGVILLRELLVRRAGDGAGVLVSSHHLDEVARIADRISVLNHGHVIGRLDPETPDLELSFFTMVHADDEVATA